MRSSQRDVVDASGFVRQAGESQSFTASSSLRRPRWEVAPSGLPTPDVRSFRLGIVANGQVHSSSAGDPILRTSDLTPAPTPVS